MKYIFSVILIIGLTASAFAGDKEAAYQEKLVKKLDLNAVQAETVKQLRDEYRAEKKALREAHYDDLAAVLDEKQLKKYIKMKKKRYTDNK